MKKEPEWKKFELTVARFFKDMGFSVRIGEEASIRGKSGAKHKIDVLILDEEGKPIKAIECKWKKEVTPVQKGDIEKFVTTCKDLGVKPIFVTNTSYSEGAKKIAFENDVELYTLEDIKGAREPFESVEEWKKDLENKDEFERFIKALEALYRSEFIRYWDIINTIYPFWYPSGKRNDIEYERLKLRDEETAKSLDLIRELFLLMELDKALIPSSSKKLNFDWIGKIIDKNPQLCESAGITLSTFRDFSKAEKIKLFFEALGILEKNYYYIKSKELYLKSPVKGDNIIFDIELFRNNFPDLLSDRSRVKLMGHILGFENLLEVIEGNADPENSKIGRWKYPHLRNIIKNELVDKYRKYKSKIDDIVNRIYFRS